MQPHTAVAANRDKGGTDDELLAGDEEGNGADAPRIDGDVGVATGFSMSVSRSS